MYNLRLKLNLAYAAFRMARMQAGDFWCFTFHRHVQIGPIERYCERCWRWWEADYCVSRYVHREWEQV